MTDAHKWVLTDEGLAEIINAENTGTAPVKLAFVGFGSGAYEANSSQTALQSEIKRVEASGGGNAGSNVIHITALDSSSDEYDIYEIGVFTESGVLFCVYSQTTPLMKKTAGSYLLVASDIIASSFAAESVTVGDTNFMNPPATTETAGVVFLATTEETIAGTDQLKAVTPAGVQAFYDDIDGALMHRASNETVTGQKFIYAPFSVYAKLLHSPAGSRQCILAMARDYVSGMVPANETMAGDSTRGFRVLDKNSGTLGYFMAGVGTNGVTSSSIAARNTFLNGALNTDGEEKTAELKVGLDSEGTPFFNAGDAGYNGNLTPYGHDQYSLGSEEYRWRAVYSRDFIGDLTGTATNATNATNAQAAVNAENATNAEFAQKDTKGNFISSYVHGLGWSVEEQNGVNRVLLEVYDGNADIKDTVKTDEMVLRILRGNASTGGYGLGAIRLLTLTENAPTSIFTSGSIGWMNAGETVAGTYLRNVTIQGFGANNTTITERGNGLAGTWCLLTPLAKTYVEGTPQSGYYGVALAIRVA